MKTIAPTLVLLLSLNLVSAQEPVTLEKAQNAARITTEALASSGEEVPKMELDLERPSAVMGGEAGFLVIPVKGATVDKIPAIEASTVPLGQLWMLRAAPARDGKPAAKEYLRRVKVTRDNFDETVSVFFLGVRKDAWGGLELLVFARTKEPLLVLPLRPMEQSQSQPIELGGQKTGDATGVLQLNLLGKYQASIDLVRAE